MSQVTRLQDSFSMSWETWLLDSFHGFGVEFEEVGDDFFFVAVEIDAVGGFHRAVKGGVGGR